MSNDYLKVSQKNLAVELFFCLFYKWCTESNPPQKLKVQQKTVFAAHFFVCIDLLKR